MSRLPTTRKGETSGVPKPFDLELPESTASGLPPRVAGSCPAHGAIRANVQAESQEALGPCSLRLDVPLGLSFSLGLETTGGTCPAFLFLPSASLQDMDRKHAQRG